MTITDNIALESLCDNIVDCPHSTPNWVENGIVVIRNFNIKNGKFDFSNISYTDENTYYERIRRAIPESGDLVISREAPMGEVCMIPEGLKCCLGQRVVLLKPNKNKVNNTFLLYALLSKSVQNQILSHENTGSTVSNLRIPVLKNLKIPKIDINQQNKISQIVIGIDNKINFCSDFNKKLSELIDILFKELFIQKNNNKAFNLSTFSEIVYESKIKVNSSNITVLSALNSGELKPSDEYFKKQVYSKDIGKYKVVEKFDFAYNPARANIGSIGMWDREQKGCVSPVYVAFRTKPGWHYFVDLMIKQPNIRKTIEVYCSGSVRQVLKFSDFCRIEIKLPPEEEVFKFNEVYQSVLDKINHNKKQIEALTKLRDTILPRLMSGEMEIKE